MEFWQDNKDYREFPADPMTPGKLGKVREMMAVQQLDYVGHTDHARSRAEGPPRITPLRTICPTDLTHRQWERVYQAVLAPAGYPESVREVVNGVRYWERACVIWWLLPPGFPPPSVLREHYQRWMQDGIWDKLQEVLRKLETEASEPHLRTSWEVRRKRIAQSVRKMPAGFLALAVGRVPIQLVQFLHRLASPHHSWLRRLYRVIRQGDRAIIRKQYETAIRWYTEAVELAPWHPHPLLGRATALFELADYPQVIQDCTIALAARLATADHRARAHAMIAWSLVLSGGDVDRAVRHQTEAWWAYDCDQAGVEEGIGSITRLEALMAAHDDLAEYLINFHMAFPVAMELYRRKPVTRSQFLPRLGEHLNYQGLILSEDWVRNIGHTAYLDTFAKMRAMGWASWDRMVLLAPPAATANLHYAKYWAGHYDVITDRRLADAVRVAARTTGPRVASLMRLPDGTEKYFTEGIGAVQEEWERQGRGPLLTLTPEDQAFGQEVLAKLGVPPGGWFVCLHVREPGYHKEWNNKHQEHRNADIQTYYRAMKEIVRRGGWVIRLGDKTMRRLPKMRGVVDYAHSKYKSERMDVFLCGACRFFVGVASGMCHVPTSFGIPCVLTNWVSNALPVNSKDDVFLPKLLHSEGLGRRLNFSEMFGPVPRQAAYSGVFLDEHELIVIDNTPAEIMEVVAEMLDRLDGATSDSLGDRELQERLAAVLRANGLIGFARMGRGFLRRHAGLLPPVVSETVPSLMGRAAA